MRMQSKPKLSAVGMTNAPRAKTRGARGAAACLSVVARRAVIVRNHFSAPFGLYRPRAAPAPCGGCPVLLLSSAGAGRAGSLHSPVAGAGMCSVGGSGMRREGHLTYSVCFTVLSLVVDVSTPKRSNFKTTEFLGCYRGTSLFLNSILFM